MCDRKLCLQSQLQVLRCLVSATFVNQKAEYCRSFLSFGLDGKQLWTFFMLFFLPSFLQVEIRDLIYKRGLFWYNKLQTQQQYR